MTTKKVSQPKANEVINALDSVQSMLGSALAFPCLSLREGRTCMEIMREERDSKGRTALWYGPSCTGALHRLCDTCLTYWLVAVAKNMVVDVARTGHSEAVTHG